MIEIQPRDDLEHRLWRTVLELAERQPEGWTLVGAQMVMLHGWEHGVVPTRTSRDLDVLVNIKALAGGTQQFARQLLDVGFELGVVTPDGRGHRFEDVELEKMGFRPTSAFPSLEMDPGVDVTVAIDVDVATMAVDQEMLDRWDMTIERVAAVALGNLRREVGTWSGTIYTDSSYEDIPIRGLEGWPAWATSLLLLLDDLKRLFGDHDQLFIAPYQCCLLSLPIDVDRDVAADIVDLFGLLNPRSLLIGVPAFALRVGGSLRVEPLPGFPDNPAFETTEQLA